VRTRLRRRLRRILRGPGSAGIAGCPRGLSALEAASLPEDFSSPSGRTVLRPRAPRAGRIAAGARRPPASASPRSRSRRRWANRVYATAGSNEKCAACVKLGAEKAINYKTQDFLAEIKALTGGKGVNVILDMVGGDYVPKELKCLADDGRLVFIAMLGGSKTELDINEVMRRRLVVTGSTLRPRPVEFKGAVASQLKEVVWPLIRSRQNQAGDLQDLPARPGERGAQAEWNPRAYRQDRARGLGKTWPGCRPTK